MAHLVIVSFLVVAKISPYYLQRRFDVHVVLVLMMFKRQLIGPEDNEFGKDALCHYYIFSSSYWTISHYYCDLSLTEYTAAANGKKICSLQLIGVVTISTSRG